MRGRAAALLVGLALVAASCGADGDDPTLETAASSTTQAPAPGEEPATTDGTVGVATTAPGEDGTTAEPPPTTSAAAPAETAGPPGAAAAFYLRPDPADSIVLEISAQDGAEPLDGTVEHVRSTLAEVSGKDVRVTAGGPVAAHELWRAGDIRAAADSAAVTPQGERAVIRMLFVHGEYAESDTALGVAVRADTAAIFADKVADAANPLVGPAAIEAAVVTHEIGHLLGLVDLFLDTGRDDPEHPGHSTNRGSVMYWAVESTLVADLLTGGPPRRFDEADRADLAAIRDG